MESPLVCRCEEVSVEDVKKAIREGATTVDGVKRRTRAGMGFCQGKSCGRLVAGIIASELGIPVSEVLADRVRPPVRPISLAALAGAPHRQGTADEALWTPPALPDEQVSNDGSRSIDERCEYLVIGGGVLGSAIAYYLVLSGKEVVLVDREPDFCRGTSRATQAWIWATTKTPVSYTAFSKRSAEMHASLSAELEADTEFRGTGGMLALLSGPDMAKQAAHAAAARSAGLPVETLGPREALALEPMLNPGLVGAVYGPWDGNVNPFALVYAFLAKAVKLGLRAYTRAAVEQIEPDKGWWAVSTGRGQIRCRVAVVAAGTGSVGVLRQMGAKLPIEAVRGQVLVTEPVPQVVKLTHQGVRQNPTGQIMVGHVREAADLPNCTTIGVVRDLAREAVHYLPFLAQVKVIRAFSGIRPMPVDGLPIVGWVSRSPQAFVCVTHSGITLSPLLGQLVTRSLIQGVLQSELAPYTIERFAG